MQTWTTFLATQPLAPLSTAIIQQTVISDISHFGLIRVAGQDAAKFLQGQFTNDVRQVKPQRSQLNAWCTPQGRVIVNFHLFQRDMDYYLLLPVGSVAPVLKRLQMFVLRSAVALSDATETLAKFGMAGDHAPQLLAEALQQELPENIDDCVTHAAITVIKTRGLHPSYLVFGEVETLINLWQSLATVAPPVATPYWQLLAVFAGLPQIDTRLSEVFVPQMLNLQALSAVNFKKGCYTGQEVVARMQYLAALKRRLFYATLRTDTPPQVGDELVLCAKRAQEIGKIVNVIAHPDGNYHLLAVVAIDAAQTQTICDRSGNTLQWSELPYDVPLR
jgi:tRNA-modifying protein YgfZ